jgi:hypothetical protein
VLDARAADMVDLVCERWPATPAKRFHNFRTLINLDSHNGEREPVSIDGDY